MTSPLPQHLQDEQRALEAEIREAFKGVTREGGVSWSEAEKMDGPCDDEQLAEARASDSDRNWTELAQDRSWDPGPGVGGWPFLDPISFRYYLPAAMIQALAGYYNGHSSAITMDIVLDVDIWDEKQARMGVLTRLQKRCIARFVRFMVDRDAADGNDAGSSEWQRVYDEHWESMAHT